jgi:hypothetical protein
MKKIFQFLLATIIIVSCKKETPLSYTSTLEVTVTETKQIPCSWGEVYLYNSYDDCVKNKNIVKSKMDTTGVVRFENLANQKYYIWAVNQCTMDSTSTPIATPILKAGQTTSITIYTDR